MTDRIGIVGAGVAGCGVAHALAGGDALRAVEPAAALDTDVQVTVLEKSRGVGGRAATRRRDGTTYYYDHGANYVKEADERTVELLHALGEDGLVAFEEPVWPFTGDGEISESQREPEPKFTWETGITQFAKRLLGETDATVRKGTRAVSATYDDAWTVRDADGATHGPFDALVVTPPAPQTARLLGETTVESSDAARSDMVRSADATQSDHLAETVTALQDRVADVPFRTTRTAVLGYDEPLDREWYALVNTDGAHEIGWLAREECKDGHVPPGENVLIAQMAPDYSERTYDDASDAVANDAAERVATLLDEPRLAEPAWTDDQGWRYAQPNETLTDTPLTDRAARAGLFLAGDWLVPDGKGRVHEAYWRGTRVARDVADRLDD